jgi:hypothetical protein
MNKFLSVIGYIGLLVVTLWIVGLWLDHRYADQKEQESRQKTIDFLHKYGYR